MKNKENKYRVAAVQSAAVYLDMDATVEKACGIIKEAAENGAKLVAFPEAYIPGYPWWVYIGPPKYGQQFLNRLYANSVEIPSEAVSNLSNAARDNHIYVCISVTERDGGTLYLTQLWFAPDGNLIGKHRKLKPTNGERYVWGCGDGSMLPVMKTELGNLGGLQCWEHILPVNIAAMNALNEQIHVCAWPATNNTIYDEWKDLFSQASSLNCARYYAIATQTFVLSCSQIYTQEMTDMLITKEGMVPPQEPGGACTCILNPNGHIISQVDDPSSEGICYADIDVLDTVKGRSVLDNAGHSSNPSAVRLNLSLEHIPACNISGEFESEIISYEKLNIDRGKN